MGKASNPGGVDMRPSRGEKYINTRVERTPLPQGIPSDTKNKQERGNQKKKKKGKACNLTHWKSKTY